MYCSRCRRIVDAAPCPLCGNKKTAPPLPDDICFLTEVDSVWSGMLEDVLKQNGIPALQSSTIGAGMAMKTGSMFERIRFFVRYEHLAQASEIADSLFSDSGAQEGEE